MANTVITKMPKILGHLYGTFNHARIVSNANTIAIVRNRCHSLNRQSLVEFDRLKTVKMKLTSFPLSTYCNASQSHCSCRSMCTGDNDKPEKQKKRVLDRFMQSLRHYEHIAETKLPMYKTFKCGFTSFVSDMRVYYSMTYAMWNGKPMETFTRKELEIYRQLPGDIMKMGPFMLITILPLTVYIIFPLAYYFPKYLLSRHFWTDDQKRQHRVKQLAKSLQHYSAVLTCLHRVTKHLSTENRSLLQSVLQKIEHSQNASAQDVLSLQSLFTSRFSRIERLPVSHQRHLAKTLQLPLTRLKDEGKLLRCMDVAISREGLTSLTDRDLERACFWRGLNPVGLTRSVKEDYLSQWLDVSRQLSDSNISLLLHSHIFMAYNYPSNQQMLRSTTTNK